MKKKYIWFLIYYIGFILFCILSGLYLGNSIKHELFKLNPPKAGTNFTWIVFTHNSRNFLSYILMPFLSPILQMSDLIGSTFQFTIAYKKSNSLNFINPHIFIEIPNMILYQGVSQYILFETIYNKSFIKVIYIFKKCIYIYISSFLLLIMGVLLEGTIL